MFSMKTKRVLAGLGALCMAFAFSMQIIAIQPLPRAEENTSAEASGAPVQQPEFVQAPILAAEEQPLLLPQNENVADSTATPPASADSTATPPASADSTATPPAQADSAATPPASADSAAAPPASADSTATPPSSDDSAATPPSSADSVATPPAQADSAATPPASAASTATPPASAASTATPPAQAVDNSAKNAQSGTAPVKPLAPKLPTHGRPAEIPMPFNFDLFTISFYDSDNSTILKKESVQEGQILAAPVPIVSKKEGFTFEYWMVNNAKFDFTSEKINANISAYPYMKPEASKYKVVFEDAQGKKTEKTGILSGTKLEDAFKSWPDTGTIENSRDIAWYQNGVVSDGYKATKDTVVNGDMYIVAKALRDVTFKGFAGSTIHDDIRQAVVAGDFCNAPYIQITETKQIDGRITIESSRVFKGWYNGSERVCGAGESFTPIAKDTTLTPHFDAAEQGRITVTFELSDKEIITLTDVPINAVIYLSNVVVKIPTGKNHTGWRADINGNEYTHNNISTIDLASISGIKSVNTINFKPCFDAQQHGVKLVAPYGYTGYDYREFTISPIEYDKPISFANAPFKTKEALDAAVKVPEPLEYLAQNSEGKWETKKITYTFNNEWLVTSKGESYHNIWDFNKGVIENITLEALITNDAPNDENQKPIQLYKVAFFNTAFSTTVPAKVVYVPKGSQIPSPPDILPRNGFSFNGQWSLSATPVQAVFNMDSKVDRDLNLYTIWAQNASVTLNSESEFVYHETVKENETLSESAREKCKPENVKKGGLVCQGWSVTRQNGRPVAELVQFDITQSFTQQLIADNNGNIRLWAWYDLATTKVNFHYCDNTPEKPEETVVTKSITANMPLVLPQHTPTDRDGYHFDGWSLSKDGAPLPAGYKPEKDKTTDVYALWSSGYTLQYYVGDVDDESNKPTIFGSLVHSLFWPNADKAVPAMEYVPDYSGSGKAKYIPETEWYKEPECINKITDFSALLKASASSVVKVYGKLITIPQGSCRIVLDANGGKFTKSRSRLLRDISDETKEVAGLEKGKTLWVGEYAAEIALLDNSVKLPAGDNRVGMGWFEDKECTRPARPRVPMTKDTTYYRGWACPVSFMGEGVATGTETNVIKETGVICKASPSLQDQNGSELFLEGWDWEYTGNYDKNISTPKDGELWDFQTNVVQNKLTLTAVWDYCVTFDTQQGTMQGDINKYVRKSAISDKTISKPADPYKSGYSFKGWYLNPTDETTEFVFKQKGRGAAAKTPTAIDANTTLYALWEPLPYVPPKPTEPTEPIDPIEPIDPPKPIEPPKPIPPMPEPPAVQPDTPQVIPNVFEYAPPPAVKLPKSGLPSMFSVLGMGLMLPWLSTISYKKFKKKMGGSAADNQNE